MNIELFLIDLKNYCEYNNITFKDMSKSEIKKHIRNMCKEIAHKTNLKQ